MSSNLKVNTILPSTGTTIGIGTVGGLINVVGNIDVNSTSGISTFNGLEISGIVTAKAGAAVTYYGDGSNLTGITDNVVTINNNADNRVITGSGTANTLRGESGVVITSDSELIVGMSAGSGSSPDARLQVRGDTFAKAQIQVLSTHNDDNPASLQISKSRSSGNTILGDNDDIGQINFGGNDGNGYHNVGRIMVSSSGEGNGNDDLPTVMKFFTTANGSVSLTERMRLNSNGSLSIANTRNYYGALNVEAGVITSGSSAIDIKASGTDKQAISFGDHNTISRIVLRFPLERVVTILLLSILVQVGQKGCVLQQMQMVQVLCT